MTTNLYNNINQYLYDSIDEPKGFDGLKKFNWLGSIDLYDFFPTPTHHQLVQDKIISLRHAMNLLRLL